MSRRLLGPGHLLTPRPTHHWSILFMSSVMYEKVDERIQELEQTLGQMAKLPLDMRVTDVEQNMRRELRELRESSRTTCPVQAILLVVPPENDGGLDPKDERLREWIYKELFGLDYNKPRPSSGLSSLFD